MTSLYRLSDSALLRAATPTEEAASIAAALLDGGIGAILVDGVTCYVA